MNRTHPTDQISLEEALDIATLAGKQAGKRILSYSQDGFRIEHKNPINLVTDADHAAEQCVIDIIRSRYPDHAFLGEERGRSTGGSSPYLWIIDPLDGTTNFAHGFPAYCVSIGLEYNGEGVVGAVYDPTRDELFTAIRGSGARLNGQAIRVSTTAELDQALLVTGFAYDIRETAQNNLDHFNRFALRAQGLRRTGSAALDLCYVAAGRFDGFWEVKLNPWDMAAGCVILREAGGTISNFRGDAHSVYKKELVSSNGLIHSAMLSVIKESLPPN